MKSMNLECNPISVYYDAVEEWFMHHMAESLFDNKKDWVEHLWALTEYEDDLIVDECCDDVSDPGDESSWFEVANALSDIANCIIIQENIDVDQYLS